MRDQPDFVAFGSNLVGVRDNFRDLAHACSLSDAFPFDWIGWTAHTLPILIPGTRLGRYEIHSLLGVGGMGEVYLAWDTRLDRRVALKILPDAVAGDPDRMMRFAQEAKAASGLNHPNIITIYEIDQSASTSFIATEFIDGSTLRERMRTPPISPAEVLDVGVQVAGALTAAHANGIVHRDIKPENVIIRSDGIVKVLDFGLAKLTGQGPPDGVDGEAPTRADFNTAPGLVMGTATYMSPEQARGQQVDSRTDIFSLGVVLYELLTGRQPYGGSNIYETVAAVLSDREAPPVSSYSSGIPAELDRIVAKALRKNREERYQTAKDFLLDLQSLRQRLALERTHPSSAGRDEKVVSAGSPRGMRLAILSVLCGLLVLGGGAIGYGWWKQAHVSSEPEIKSLAVLPLKSLDAGENYLGLGLADAAIRRVSQTGRLIVRPTSAVRRYLSEDTDALTAARQLGVDAVLEGSWQRAGDRLRVSVNLLRSVDGRSLWTDSFDILMADIFTIQDTVAQQVASRLRLQLDASQQAQLTKRYTSNPVAYEFYLKGVYAFDQRRLGDSAQKLDTAAGFYKKAIEADPSFALAHAQLAYVYATRAVFLEPDQPAWLALAREEIDLAGKHDPRLAETHLARFQLLYSQFEGYQPEAAAREAVLANRLNPNVGHRELAYMYNHLGLEDLATRELARFAEIDPTSEARQNGTLLMYEVQLRYDDYAADRSVRHEGKMEAMYLIDKGRLDEARQAIDQWSAKLQADNRMSLSTNAVLLAAQADFHAAEAQIPIILAKHPLKDPLYHHAAYDIACVYALEGKSAEAVKWLRESAVNGFHLYPRYTRDALLNRIRQSPEFIRFLAEMKAENDRYRREFS